MALPLKVNTTPLIFILSPGTDPVSDVIRFAEQLLGHRMPQMEDAWTWWTCNKQKSLVRLVSMGRTQHVALPNVRMATRCQGWNGQKVRANLLGVAHSAKIPVVSLLVIWHMDTIVISVIIVEISNLTFGCMIHNDGYSIDPPRQGQGPRAQSLIDRARQTGGAIHETAWLNALSMARFFG